MMNLIDKQDNITVVRDAIALILKQETLNQQALATAAGLDPEDWEYEVYVERSEPWSLFGEDLVPIVSVVLEGGTVAGVTDGNQVTTGTYAIKVYTASPAGETAMGHDPADYRATMRLQRVVMLLRNILMSWENRYLKIDKKIVRTKGISEIEFFPGKEISSTHIAAGQITMTATFKETTEMPSPSILEETDITIEKDGSVINKIKVEL